MCILLAYKDGHLQALSHLLSRNIEICILLDGCSWMWSVSFFAAFMAFEILLLLNQLLYLWYFISVWVGKPLAFGLQICHCFFNRNQISDFVLYGLSCILFRTIGPFIPSSSFIFLLVKLSLFLWCDFEWLLKMLILEPQHRCSMKALTTIIGIAPLRIPMLLISVHNLFV